jgi:crotonobetainyl-CoA:carnitine CoA-transferase CaiB-like acyl-CoA transferase
MVANPIHLSATPPEYRMAPPLLGEHTNEVLRGVLALEEDEITALTKASIIQN